MLFSCPMVGRMFVNEFLDLNVSSTAQAHLRTNSKRTNAGTTTKTKQIQIQISTGQLPRVRIKYTYSESTKQTLLRTPRAYQKQERDFHTKQSTVNLHARILSGFDWVFDTGGVFLSFKSLSARSHPRVQSSFTGGLGWINGLLTAGFHPSKTVYYGHQPWQRGVCS